MALQMREMLQRLRLHLHLHNPPRRQDSGQAPSHCRHLCASTGSIDRRQVLGDRTICSRSGGERSALKRRLVRASEE